MTRDTEAKRLKLQSNGNRGCRTDACKHHQKGRPLYDTKVNMGVQLVLLNGIVLYFFHSFLLFMNIQQLGTAWIFRNPKYQ
jgi:hypothetical protein